MRTHIRLLVGVLVALAACDAGPTNVDADWVLGYWKYDGALCQPGEIRHDRDSFGYPFALEFTSFSTARIHRGDSVQAVRLTLTRRSTGGVNERALVAAFSEPLIFGFEEFLVDQDGPDAIVLGYWGVIDGCWYWFLRDPS